MADPLPVSDFFFGTCHNAGPQSIREYEALWKRVCRIQTTICLQDSWHGSGLLYTDVEIDISQTAGLQIIVYCPFLS